jgi:hypothetical protein
MSMWSLTARSVVLVLVLAAASPARAIPALARKYATSCNTCHTVYPKLTPFGEAFRRNGYRFPGVDSDFIKADQVALGQESNKKTFPATVWPAAITSAVPLSVGANGQAFITPSKTSSAGVAQNGALVTLQDLAAEGHLWGSVSLDDTITTWLELTIADGGAEVEHAQLLFNDLLGPKHAVNLVVGKGFTNITQYGPHSSYLGDQLITTVPVTDIYGLTGGGGGVPGQSAWALAGNNYTGAEVNGVVEGRFDYSVGITAGETNGVRAPTDNFYGHVGYKLGGMRLDGENSSGAADSLRPWAEDSLGVYAFGYQSNTRIATLPAIGINNDVANVFGVGGRGQYGSTELNLGWYSEAHNHGYADGTKVTASVGFAELSYVLYPWLVPALRVESISLKPAGGTSVSDLHLQPGIAFLIRPNVKLVATFDYESAGGFPSPDGGTNFTGWAGGASGWGAMQIAPKDPAVGAKRSEFESVGIFLAWAM